MSFPNPVRLAARLAVVAGCVAGLAIVAIGATRTAHAERPPAFELLPANTFVFFQVTDVPQLKEKFANTAAGRLSQDPQLKPLLGRLYGSAVEAFAGAEEQVGLTLTELLDVPQGEIAFAVVPRGGDGRPAPVLLFDAGEGERAESADVLFRRASDELERRSIATWTEEVAGTTLSIYSIGGRADEVVLFRRGGTLVLAGDVSAARQMLRRWSGDDGAGDDEPLGEPLAKNAGFAAVMKESRATRERPVQAVAYADPIGLARAILRGDLGGELALAVLPVIGLDSLTAVGGSLALDVGEFDVVTRLHVLLDRPRTGVLEFFAFGSGDTRPQDWVPADVSDYTTLYWNAQQTYDAVKELVDSLQGEGATERYVQRQIEDPIGIDFEEELIAAMNGRVTHLTWYEQPTTFTSAAQLVAIELKDAEAMQATLARVADRFADRVEKKEFGGVTYYETAVDRRAPDAGFASPPAVFAVVGDCLMLTRESFLKKVVVARADPRQRLADSAEYQQIAARIERLAGTSEPAMVSFEQPEDQVRFLYDLALNEETQRRLATQAESVEFFRVLNEALKEHPLPPFAVIAKYLAPSGAVLVDNETGLHYTGFTLKREEEK